MLGSCRSEPLWVGRRVLRRRKGLADKRGGCWRPSKMNVTSPNPCPATHPPLYPTSQPAISPPQRPAKPSEKPRLRQIPSAEDLETDGGGVGPVVSDVLERRESGHGPPEGRGPVSLQQRQQVWLGPGTLQSSVRRLDIMGKGKGDRIKPTPRRRCPRACVCVHVCVRVHIHTSTPLSQVDPLLLPASWLFTEPHVLPLHTSPYNWLSFIQR